MPHSIRPHGEFLAGSGKYLFRNDGGALAESGPLVAHRERPHRIQFHLLRSANGASEYWKHVVLRADVDDLCLGGTGVLSAGERRNSAIGGGCGVAAVRWTFRRDGGIGIDLQRAGGDVHSANEHSECLSGCVCAKQPGGGVVVYLRPEQC